MIKYTTPTMHKMMAEATIQETQNAIVEEFAFFEDWTDKYGYIIELGKNLPELDDKHKTDENKIKGCQSNVWLHTHMNDGRIYFEGDSDAMIVRGLVSMLIRVLNGQEPDAILNADMDFLDKIGLQQHLSPTRANGLASMVKQMKMYALAYKAKGR